MTFNKRGNEFHINSHEYFPNRVMDIQKPIFTANEAAEDNSSSSLLMKKTKAKGKVSHFERFKTNTIDSKKINSSHIGSQINSAQTIATSTSMVSTSTIVMSMTIVVVSATLATNVILATNVDCSAQNIYDTSANLSVHVYNKRKRFGHFPAACCVLPPEM